MLRTQAWGIRLAMAGWLSVSLIACGSLGNGNGDDGGGTTAEDGGTTDDMEPDNKPIPPTLPSVDDPTNATKDSDCDGLSDEDEFSIVYAGGKKTDPANADSDGDGIKDGVERGRDASVNALCGFVADADSASTTSPTESDSDADGLPDGIEDANHNGAVELDETDPREPDSDGDGLSDGAEDVNHNGAVDSSETDPRKKDTDGDGINDRVELVVTHTSPTNADTDGDTCLDGAEDFNRNGTVDSGETNPLVADCGAIANPDADMDGIPDAVETANGTNPNVADSDGDGLPDGLEDRNHNGAVDVGETNPRRKDSDCDGLIDGPTAGATLGEDLDGNGIKDANETDATKFDTDGDGIRDGVERGVTVNPDAACTNFLADANNAMGNNSDPLNPDSDGDGIVDGAEDANQNGGVDSGELNPNNPADGTGPAGQVCPTNKLRNVIFRQEGNPDLSLALEPTFTELTTVTVGGTPRGIIGYDATHQTAFLLYRQAAPGASTTPLGDEGALRTSITTTGVLSNVTTQTFTTWDGYAAVQAFYDQAGNADLKTRANALADALLAGSTGRLSATAGATGPFKIQAEYVHRSNASVVVLVAITPFANYVEPSIFTVNDTAGGSALAQFGDSTAVQCEVFAPASQKVDFLFAVDNSNSMGAHQQALADTATAMATALNNSTLDWRIAMVTSRYDRSNQDADFREFTTNINEFRAWLTQNSTCQANLCSGLGVGVNVACVSNNDCWVGTSGGSPENVAMASAKAISMISTAPLTPAGAGNRLRSDATLVVILLGDADDQSPATLAQLNTFFTTQNATVTNTTPDPDQTYTNRVGAIRVHGVLCVNGNCPQEAQDAIKNVGIVAQTGGVAANIQGGQAAISSGVAQFITSTIGQVSHQLGKPPIGASIKVAMDVVEDGVVCDKNDIPRSRVDGFDFDGVNRSISFFGACRPTSSSTAAAVSYRYWINNTGRPDGSPAPCQADPYFDPNDPDWCQGTLVCNEANVCQCPGDCGQPSPPPGKTCDTNPAVCDFVCTADCGGTCGSYKTCNTNTCTCECAQTASCPAGFVFSSDNGQCGCVCDTAALNCGSTYQADPNSCSCVCKPNCGGCAEGSTCNQSACACSGQIG